MKEFEHVDCEKNAEIIKQLKAFQTTLKNNFNNIFNMELYYKDAWYHSVVDIFMRQISVILEGESPWSKLLEYEKVRELLKDKNNLFQNHVEGQFLPTSDYTKYEERNY